MSKHVLITGGAGYIGALLTGLLLDNDYKVTVIDNFTYAQTALLNYCINPNFSVINGDVRDADTMLPLIKKADIIIPLACLVGAPLCKKDPVGATSINSEAIQLIMKHRSTTQYILFPTTNSGYGVGEEGVFCTEETPLRPISLYGRLKVEIEDALLNAGNAITFRLATVFGASPRPRLDLLVNDFTYRAVKDRFIVLFEAHFKRNYLHVRDAAAVFLHGITHFDSMKNEPYNVGLSDANISKMELCNEIKHFIPDFYVTESAISEDPDKRNYIVSNDKIEATGFKASIGLREGIEELIKAYQMLSNDRYTNI